MADVTATFSSISSTESSNSPSGNTNVGTGMDDNLRMIEAHLAAWRDQTAWGILTLTTIAGTANAITATLATAGSVTFGPTALANGMKFLLLPGSNNSGATTLTITSPNGGSSLGAKNIFINGAACSGGELIASVPAILEYDGTQFHIIANALRHAIVQRAYQEYLTNADLTTTIPLDDTIPQITEGTEIMTQAITPKSASNRIRIRFQCFASNSGAAGVNSVAFFVDATANALAASASWCPTATGAEPLVLEHEESAASTSARTYRVRVGPATGTLRLNGQTTTRLFGGVAKATLVVEEIS